MSGAPSSPLPTLAALRARRALRSGKPWQLPLDALRERRAREPLPTSAAGIAALAAELGLPPARLRAVLAFYPDLAPGEAALRVCRGTSCALRGGAALEGALDAAGIASRPVHCLGHCDRSPCLLDRSGRVHTALDPRALPALDEPPAPGTATTRVAALCDEPIVTARIGRGDFSSLDAARADGVYAALAAALARPPQALLEEIERSGERGRGGAAFPTARKWRAVAAAEAPVKFAIANGDEGDPGSFVDRVLLERDPHAVLEGLALCAYAIGARHGVVFIRSEYPAALARMRRAVADAERAGLLGRDALGPGAPLEVRVFEGLGRYVCGEETSLIAALEGDPGEVRLRPPYPSEHGLFGFPTAVNNVETLVNVPWIAARGGAAYAARGTAASSGTLALSLSAGFATPGIVEVELGTSLAVAIAAGGGTPCDRAHLAGVQLGGPMGTFLRPEECDVPICYGAMAARGIQLGHGGVVCVPTDFRAGELLANGLGFMARESCGRCVPCGVGSRRILGELRAGALTRDRLEKWLALCQDTSLCAFGRGIPGPLRRLLAEEPGLPGGVNAPEDGA